jgi:hypothetical protein
MALFFAVAIQTAIEEIDEVIMSLHSGSDSARASAFADDGVVLWDATTLRFPHHVATIHALTDLHVESPSLFAPRSQQVLLRLHWLQAGP